MPWVRVDDHFDEHPKMQQVGPLGWGIWLAGLAYCNRNLTDGFIPWAKARALASFEVVEDDGQLWRLSRSSGMTGMDIDADWVIGLLVEAGLWDVIENGRGRIDGYQIHDYDQFQPSREQVVSEREKNAERQRRFRERNAKSNNVSNTESNKNVTPLLTDASRNGNKPPVPVPQELINPLPPKRESKRSKVRAERPPDDESGPFAAVSAMCERLGTDPHVLDSKDLAKQCRKAQELLKRDITIEEIAGFTGFLLSQSWRSEPIDMFTVANGIAKWRLNGRPESADARASPPGQRVEDLYERF